MVVGGAVAFFSSSFKALVNACRSASLSVPLSVPLVPFVTMVPFVPFVSFVTMVPFSISGSVPLTAAIVVSFFTGRNSGSDPFGAINISSLK